MNMQIEKDNADCYKFWVWEIPMAVDNAQLASRNKLFQSMSKFQLWECRRVESCSLMHSMKESSLYLICKEIQGNLKLCYS